ncbi:MAG: glutamate-cysteine ligase family protein [Candidatus Kapabacteria bacterium]|nr:glutamate-cysteine ligase family protein [Candidatus Kapabacteria bacterium]
MGEQKVSFDHKLQDQQRFMLALLDDIQALEMLIESGRIEKNIRRIGAEQEMFLVDANMRPALVGPEILQATTDERLTSEIGRFNLEANLEPSIFSGSAFRQMEDELNDVVRSTQQSADSCGAHVLLTGILPTMRQRDLSLESMTPKPRYHALNHALTQLRGHSFSAHIKGLDEITITHDNMLLEAACTSFQVHLQVSAEEFAQLYNIAQAITAPVLAAAANSPVLFGHRLWHETRLALFQHSVDERSEARLQRRHPHRVSFGESWVESSVVEIFRDEIARFRLILTKLLNGTSTEKLRKGEIPELDALRLHNGTVWRWNRPCYGIMDGVPHLRIENRVIPSGPTVLDEVANAAFFLGLMMALPQEYGDIRYLLPFDAAKDNFLAAARHGLRSQFTWLNNTLIPAPDLITSHLLPLAEAGLRSVNIDGSDIERYLGVLQERVERKQNGALWALESLSAMHNEGTCEQQHRALTAAMLSRQQHGTPVHTWELARLNEQPHQDVLLETVEEIMTKDLLTVRTHDVVDFVVNLMTWNHIRHVPVENDAGELQGIISYTDILRFLTVSRSADVPVPVAADVMQTNVISISPDTSIREAYSQMERFNISCLPIVAKGLLQGVVTKADMLRVFAKEQHLRL